MELDAYQRCVGGCDKKIKFCCGTKILGDLNGVFAAIEADQKASALDQINRAIAKQGEKDCLLATKVSVLIQLNQYEQATALVDTLLSRNPVNPVALGQRTTLLAVAGDSAGALDSLQLALEHYDRTISRGVMNAIRIVGALLHSMGNPLAARAHLTLYSSLSTTPDEEVGQLLLHSYSDPDTPILLKHDYDLPVAPEGGSWSAEYNALRLNAQRGRWRSTLARMRELDESHPGQPILRKAIAVLENRIGDPASQAAAWLRYSETPGVPTDEAIEAAALSLVIGGDTLNENVSSHRLTTFQIKDTGSAIEQLSKDPRASAHAEFRVPDGSPPPKAVFSILDRAALRPDATIELESIPNVQGTAIIYGRETDREPRVEIEGYSGHGLETAIQLVRDALGPDISTEATADEELGTTNVIDLLFSVRWHITQPIEPEQRRDLLERHIRSFLMDSWPLVPLTKFGGLNATEAARDPANHRPLLAWLLMTEEVLDNASFGWIDLNPLRAKLGLPERATISPVNINLDRLPIYRFSKLDFEAMTDQQLDRAMYLGRISGHGYLVYRTTTEKLNRGTSLQPQERFHLLSMHAQATPNISEGRADFAEMEALREAAEVEEPAFLLAYMEWCLKRGQADLVEKVMSTIQKKYRNDPIVMPALGQLLVRLGILSPNGRRPHESAAEPAAQPVASTVWTPEASAPADPSSSGSKLWLPGME